jgi:hypothetical protein
LVYLPPKENRSHAAETTGDPAQSDVGSFRNLLGAKVLYVVGKTESGLVEVQDLAPDEIKMAIATDVTAAQTQLQELVFAHSPMFDFRRNRYYYEYGNEDSSWGDEHQIIDALRNKQAIPDFDRSNTFMAIVERNPLVDQQMEPVKYKKQLHVIIGQW